MGECPHTKRISNIEKALYGNERTGLIESVSRLDENVKTLINTDQQLTTTVSALVRFVSEVKGEAKERKELKIKIRWLVTIFVTLIIASASIIVTLITTRP